MSSRGLLTILSTNTCLWRFPLRIIGNNGGCVLTEAASRKHLKLEARGPAAYLRCSWERRCEGWGAEAGSEWSFAAVKPGAWPRLVGSRRRRACGWLSREQRSWRSPELCGRVWWKIKIKIDDPGAGRLTGVYENPNMGLVVWTEMLSLWCNGKWCHRMLLNRQLDGGKAAVFMSKGWLPRLWTTCAN